MVSSLRVVVALAATAVASVSATSIDIAVKASGGNATSGHQYGFIHEDINNSGDGGIYAELIRNRAFQFSEKYPLTLDGWHPVNGASLTLKNLSMPLSKALPASINVAPTSGGAVDKASSLVGFANDGYWGMDVKRHKYKGSFWVRGAYEGKFTASLRSALTTDVFGSVDIPSKAKAGEWVEHHVELTPTKDAPNSNNTFAITFDPAGAKDGSLDFNLISLFPPTYKNRANGLRIDLAEALEGLHPTYFRMPGGNMLMGNTNGTRWDWKDSIGPLKDRPGFPGVWGYQQTNGLGLLEYLLWAEDMKMTTVMAVWDGLALNGDLTPQDELDPFIQDALNEIEFVVGSVNTTWGAKRAAYGHPEPFPLEYVEIGNEDWLSGKPAGWNAYKAYRLPMFQSAINKAYPNIKIVTSGASSDGLVIPKGDIGDYHPYKTPDGFVKEFNRFDNDTTHIVGEIAAVHVNGGIEWNGDLQPFPWWIGSVAEAVALISYERNADRVLGALYAPSMRNMNRWQWAVTILQHAADTKLTTKSTSWYVWELLAAHPMTNTLPATETFGPLYYVAGTDKASDSRIWKGALYNTTDGGPASVSVTFDGVKAGTSASLTLVSGNGDPFAYNDPFTGVNIVRTNTTTVTAGADGAFRFSMPQLSVAVLDTAATAADCSTGPKPPKAPAGPKGPKERRELEWSA